MKQTFLTTSCKNVMMLMAVAAGLAVMPQTVSAEQSVEAVQQSGKINGKVLDQNGEPVIGATVKIKGSSTGTVTDMDGNFSLTATPGTALEISYIGFKTQQVKVGNGPVTIKLQEDSQSLNEVVVVGFGTQKKVNLTGSVGLATSKDLEARPVANAAAALQGVVP